MHCWEKPNTEEEFKDAFKEIMDFLKKYVSGLPEPAIHTSGKVLLTVRDPYKTS